MKQLNVSQMENLNGGGSGWCLATGIVGTMAISSGIGALIFGPPAIALAIVCAAE